MGVSGGQASGGPKPYGANKLSGSLTSMLSYYLFHTSFITFSHLSKTLIIKKTKTIFFGVHPGQAVYILRDLPTGTRHTCIIQIQHAFNIGMNSKLLLSNFHTQQPTNKADDIQDTRDLCCKVQYCYNRLTVSSGLQEGSGGFKGFLRGIQ